MSTPGLGDPRCERASELDNLRMDQRHLWIRSDAVGTSPLLMSHPTTEQSPRTWSVIPMKTLQLSSFGAPTDVVELVEVDSADPGPGQLAVSMEAAPINPSD